MSIGSEPADPGDRADSPKMVSPRKHCCSGKSRSDCSGVEELVKKLNTRSVYLFIMSIQSKLCLLLAHGAHCLCGGDGGGSAGGEQPEVHPHTRVEHTSVRA